MTESLDELSGMVATLFSPILNRGRDALPMLLEHPFGPNETGVCLFFKTYRLFRSYQTFPDTGFCSDYYGFSCHGNIFPFGISTFCLETQTGKFHFSLCGT
jgi:hypothetical protein